MRIDSRFLLRRVVRPLLWLLLAGYFLFAAAVIALRYLVLPSIGEYRPAIERAASSLVGAPVRIGAIGANWMGLNPRLDLTQVSVLDPQGRAALVLPHVATVFSWRSVLALEPRLLSFQLDAPELDVRRDAQGVLWIAGFRYDPAETDEQNEATRWLMAQRRVTIRGARMRWIDDLRQAPPLELRNVELHLRYSGLHHRVALRAEPPPSLATELDVRADFAHGLFEFRPNDVRRWSGTVYAAARRLDLAGWRPWIDLPGDVERGEGALRAWLDVSQGRAAGGVADLALTGLAVRLGDGLPALDVTRASTRARATFDADGGYRLALERAEFDTADGISLRPQRAELQWQAGERGALQLAGLDLSVLERLSDRLPMADGVRQEIVGLAPAGRLDDLALAWRGPPAQARDVSVAARFRGLSLAAAPVPVGKLFDHPQRPGFANLDGTFEGNRAGGALTIDARDATLSFPGVFAEPVLPLRRLTAQATLARSEQGVLRLEIQRAEFEHAQVSGEASGNWTSEGKSPSGTLDLTGRLLHADMRAVYRFVPLSVAEDVRTWLQHALLAGSASDVGFRVQGDLYDFPFGGTRGEFHVGGKMQGVTLDYAPPQVTSGAGWPRLEELAGDLAFDRISMSIDARSGKVRAARDATVEMRPTKARIANLEHGSVLEIDGETRGAAPSYLAFVNSSPLRDMIDGALDEASVTGNVVVPLSLRIPLDHVDDTDVTGEVQFSGNDFHLQPSLPPLQRLNGALGFSNAGLASRGVTGMLLDGPVKVTAAPREDGADVLRFEGSATAAALARLWRVPGMARLGGQAAYTAQVVLAADGPPTGLIESNLAGVSVDLPAPLGKAAADTMPLRIEWGRTAQTGGEWLAAGIGSHVNLHVERDAAAPGGGQGAVRAAVGVNRAATISGPGLGFGIDLPEVDLDQWEDIAAEFGPAAAPGPVEPAAGQAPELPALARINLKTARLKVRGRQLDDVALYAARDVRADGDWRVDVESRQLAGRLSWSGSRAASADRLTARLTHLSIGDTGQSSDEQADLLGGGEGEDSDVPEVDLVADRFELFGKSLGRLEVLASTADRGREWRLGRLSVKNPDAELEGSGVWRFEPGSTARRRLMTLDTHLKLIDTGRFLDRMGLPGTMAGGSGKLSGRVSWRGQPYSLDVPSLSGDLELELDKGQFLKADPGIAKLLGVLSLQSLPRRVTLDFRDVFSEGFAYDTIRAHVKIAGGVAHTDDFKMNGVNATVVIAGDTDLVNENQKLRVVVVPKLDAGGASLLYGLAVNPAVGLSVFLAQLLLREPLAQAFTFQYAITGGWADPHIERIPNAAPAKTPAPAELVN